MIAKLPKTIKETQEKLLAKEFTVSELVETYLARIEKYDKEINSFITVTTEEAKKEAQKADKLIAELGDEAFKKYQLLGVVTAYKDLYLTEGVKTTAASKVLENFIAPYSSTVVKKLQEAGAIMIGKTNCDAWAHGGSGENSDFGPTKNPWNKEYVPGGSSSGSAASVAADLTLISTGTDTGGSIRQPAGFTNLVGFKPTYGAVSRYGVIAMASSLDSMGHFTRTVEDAKKIFEITKGVDEKDGTVLDNNWEVAKEKLKIGVPKEYFIDGLDLEVKQIVEKAIEEYKRLGVEIVEVSLPHTKYAIEVYYIVQPAEVSSNLGRYDGVRYGEERSLFGDEAKRRIMLGTYVLSAGYYDAYYLKAMKVRSKLIEDFDNVFKQVDAILAPVSPTPPFKIGEKSSDPLQMYLADIFTVSANLAGIPGLTIPAGFTEKKLPVGFQLMGPRFSENNLFKLGEMYQGTTNVHLEDPDLD